MPLGHMSLGALQGPPHDSVAGAGASDRRPAGDLAVATVLAVDLWQRFQWRHLAAPCRCMCRRMGRRSDDSILGGRSK